MLDRGNKKWSSSIMMPELSEGLKQIFEDEKNVKKPILSEDQQEEIQSTINEAIEFQLSIEITYYKAKRLHTLKGKIIKIDHLQTQIHTGEDINYLATKDIIEVKIV